MKRWLLSSLLLTAAATLPIASLQAVPAERRVFVEFELYFTPAGNSQDPGHEKKSLTKGCFQDSLRQPMKFFDLLERPTARIGLSDGGWVYAEPDVEFKLLEIDDEKVSLDLMVGINSHITAGRVRSQVYSNTTKIIANQIFGTYEKHRGPTLPNGNQVWISLFVMRRP